MRFLAQLGVRIRMLFNRCRAATQVDDELNFHLERQIAENRAAGMNADDARTAALRLFGNPAVLRDRARATWSWAGTELLLRDLRYSARALRRSPGFALTAIVVIALGIGANVALFTVVRSVLLKPLPYRDPGRLVAIYGHDTHPGHPQWSPYLPVDAGSMLEWQRAARGLAEMAFVSPWQQSNLSSEGRMLPEKIDIGWCSWNLFEVLGVRPVLGRTFTPEDDQAGAAATVVLSHSLWKRRYSADPGIVGRTVWLDSKPYTVIGVLPTSFLFLSQISGTPQAWTPLQHEAPPSLLRSYTDHEFLVAARLDGGVRLPALVQVLAALQQRIRVAHPQAAVRNSVIGRSMLDDAVDGYKTPLWVLLGATFCVLLIACMNVAGLLVARAAARSRETAIRAALGGGRLRLMRERILETLLLTVSGGGLGLLFAWSAIAWLMRARPDMNRVESIAMDGPVLLFAAAVIAVSTLLAGFLSAASASGKPILAVLQESSRSQSAGRSRASLRRALVATEIGLTVILLAGAGILLKSYARLRGTDIGVPIDNVLTMRLSLPENQYKTEAQTTAFFEQMIARVRALPGVESAGLVSTAPGEGWGGDDMMFASEHPPAPPATAIDIMARGAEPGYFAAIHLPLLRGRTFLSDERLQRAHVVLISQQAARELFPGEDPIGKHLESEFSHLKYEIVGVVGDTLWIPSLPSQPTLYWPIYGNDYSAATIVVRAPRDADSLAIPVERVVSSLDPDLPVSDVMTLREAIGKSTVDQRFDSILILAFAVIALTLAATGLYGVLAYLVTQRTTEIGIRMALGAPRQHVLRLTLADGLRPALAGLVLGLVASAAVVREIKSMLYQTEPLDPWVFAAVAALLLAVAAMACLLPAWRASRVDPMQALRTE
jgi:predicted permease